MITTFWKQLTLDKSLTPSIVTLLLVVGFSAEAIDYQFPGTLPAGCIQSNATTYNCGAVTLADSDTLTVISTDPVTINASSSFSTGANVIINTGECSSKLNIVAVGAISIGATNSLNANLQSVAGVTVGSGSDMGGNIVASGALGKVTIAANATMRGMITTDAGAIGIGASATIYGSITTDAGRVDIGALGRICRHIIITGGGALNLASIKVGGNITTSGGAVTVDGISTVGGYLDVAGAGAITLTTTNVGGFVHAATGAVTLTDCRIGGDVTTPAAKTLTRTTVNDSTLVMAPVCP